MKKIVATVVVLGLLSSCAATPAIAVHKSFTGGASWYTGRRTASGEAFRANELTVAHRSIRFGTHVRLTNLVNNRTCVARVNDRGPFVSGRVVDGSPAVARALGFIGAGHTSVRVEVLD